MIEGKAEIIKQIGVDGLDESVVAYYAPGRKQEITDRALLDGAMDWRFSLIMCRFKSLLGLLDDDAYEKYGSIFQAVIKEAEKELDDISDFLEKSVGKISFLYCGDYRYENFTDESVVGLVLDPTGLKTKEA